MSVPIVYLPRVLSYDDVWLAWIMANAPWEERTSARYEAFWSTLSEPYTYGQGRGVRTYHPSPMPLPIQAIKGNIELLTKDLLGLKKRPTLSLCFLNRYDDEKQHLGWHADDSPEQDDDMPIVVLSLGAERELWFRENGKGGVESITKQKLESGSLLIMKPGMQQTHQHRIPKHPQPCGMRISLTWRALK